MQEPNFIEAREKASEIILLQPSNTFPIDIFNLKFNNYNVIISSIQNYSIQTGTKIEDLLAKGNGQDAYTVANIRNGIHLILYNEEIDSLGRIRWSIAHEIGHLVLEHQEQGKSQELEADTFASQLLAPQCILKQLAKSGVNLSLDYISLKFGLSKEAAKNNINKIPKKLEKELGLLYDDYINQKYSDFIKEEMPNKYINDSYFEELEEKRNLWI